MEFPMEKMAVSYIQSLLESCGQTKAQVSRFLKSLKDLKSAPEVVDEALKLLRTAKGAVALRAKVQLPPEEIAATLVKVSFLCGHAVSQLEERQDPK